MKYTKKRIELQIATHTQKQAFMHRDVFIYTSSPAYTREILIREAYNPPTVYPVEK